MPRYEPAVSQEDVAPLSGDGAGNIARRFGITLNLNLPTFGPGDGLILLLLAAVLYIGARLALNAPASVTGPNITLAPAALPWYALLSTSRMAVAYLFSLTFTIVYAYSAARNRRARIIMLPLLDILQSVPILSFLPVVLLGMTTLLPERIGVEVASIVLILTSQVWNMTFSFYQSLTTIPEELREASAIFRLNPWLRFKTMEMPFGANGLIWNSMVSWAGGWFFLMAAETFTVGARDFRLPGLGSYLQAAANAGDTTAIVLGLGTLVLVIVLLDQLVWRPILVWADRFKVEMSTGDAPPTSWFYDILNRSWLMQQIAVRVSHPGAERLDQFMVRFFVRRAAARPVGSTVKRRSVITIGVGVIAVAVIGFLAFQAIGMLITLPLNEWGLILQGVIATFLRVATALVIGVVWTVPVGVLIGSNRRAANFLQPVIQIFASIPATALFPVIVLALVGITGSLNAPAIILMLLGTQWYILFNVIAGTAAIPQDLKFTTSLLQVKGWARWRTLILPALFPYLITGLVTAGGGAWNASIVAEYVSFGGQTYSVTGIGAVIAEATATGNYALLLGATLALIISVVSINRLVWRRLYRIAEERYKME
jgi:NitT/TauT family transport system permease protein